MRKIFLACLFIFGLGVSNSIFRDFEETFFSQDVKNITTADLLFSLLGVPSLASEFALIDFTVAYGSLEGHPALEETQSLINSARRLVSLDPFFRYGVYVVVGAFAFSLNQDRVAVDLLEKAIEADPRHWPYSLYLSAITYKKADDYVGVLSQLERLRKLPDCPTMLKNIMANIYIRVGNKEAARSLYEEMLLAPEAQYQRLAQEKLKKL